MKSIAIATIVIIATIAASTSIATAATIASSYEKDWTLSEVLRKFLYVTVGDEDTWEGIPSDPWLLYTVNIGQTTSCSKFNQISMYSAQGSCLEFDRNNVTRLEGPRYSNDHISDYFATAIFVNLELVDKQTTDYELVQTDNRCFYFIVSDARECDAQTHTFEWDLHKCQRNAKIKCIKAWDFWRKGSDGEDSTIPIPPSGNDDDNENDGIINITPFEKWPLCTSNKRRHRM